MFMLNHDNLPSVFKKWTKRKDTAKTSKNHNQKSNVKSRPQNSKNGIKKEIAGT